eukprot:523856_1
MAFIDSVHILDLTMDHSIIIWFIITSESLLNNHILAHLTLITIASLTLTSAHHYYSIIYHTKFITQQFINHATLPFNYLDIDVSIADADADAATDTETKSIDHRPQHSSLMTTLRNTTRTPISNNLPPTHYSESASVYA